jgi:hypothetical protein
MRNRRRRPFLPSCCAERITRSAALSSDEPRLDFDAEGRGVSVFDARPR